MRHYKRTENPEYLIDMAVKDGTCLEDAKREYRNLIFAWEMWNDDDFRGTAFSVKRGNRFTLDGYNRYNNIFEACILGRKVIEELFEKHTSVIYTCHRVKNKSATALVKRLGFTEIYRDTQHALFIKEKNNGS